MVCYLTGFSIVHLQVFLEYADNVGCANARTALSGRKFGDNTVRAVYYPEDSYYNRDFTALKS